MNWFRAFDEPITLPNGQTLSTLRQAAEYVTRHSDSDLAQKAAGNLMRAAQYHDSGVMVWMARMAMMRLIHPEPLSIGKEGGKPKNWGRKKLKRDR